MRELESIDVNDLDQVREACSHSEEYDMPLVGYNEDGEMVLVEVTEECVITTTYQKNGWIRKDYTYTDGYSEQLFERD